MVKFEKFGGGKQQICQFYPTIVLQYQCLPFYPKNNVQPQCRTRSKPNLNIIFVLIIVTDAQVFESVKKYGGQGYLAAPYYPTDPNSWVNCSFFTSYTYSVCYPENVSILAINQLEKTVSAAVTPAPVVIIWLVQVVETTLHSGSLLGFSIYAIYDSFITI